MLNVNLLPPREKENLAYIFESRAVIAVGSAVIAVSFIFLVLLLPTFFALVFQKAEIVRAVALEAQGQERSGIAKRAERVRAANFLADRIVRYEQKQDPIAPLFQAITRAVPPSIRLHSIAFHKDRREFSLDGRAPARADLLRFTRSLEADPRVAKVTSPVSNLVREADVAFTLTITLR